MVEDHNNVSEATPSDSGLLLQPSDLLPGDVLLYRWREPDELAKRISKATNSPYTHAAICLGNNLIAESMYPEGVVKNHLDASLEGSLCVGVLRTQCGFGPGRRAKLMEFVDAIVAQGIPFHRSALVNFGERSKTFFDNQLEIVRENYGQFATPEQLAARSYFCSGFVVACFEAVGIIDSTAQAAYQPEFFSPAHLYDHPTFGWLLGYLVAEGGTIPLDDPLNANATKWLDVMDVKWW
jgi:hypothetical protein